MKWIKENLASLLTILFHLAIGILLLIDPVVYGVAIIKVVGILLAALGAVDLVKYFRAAPEEAAKGQSFYSGSVLIIAGLFCVFASGWFVEVLPALAVLYGVLQVLVGLRKLQRTVDALRLHAPLWYLQAISAGLSLLFGFLVILNPGMTFINVWVFTGITMIIEGVLDAVVLVMQHRKAPAAVSPAS